MSPWQLEAAGRPQGRDPGPPPAEAYGCVKGRRWSAWTTGSTTEDLDGQCRNSSTPAGLAPWKLMTEPPGVQEGRKDPSRGRCPRGRCSGLNCCSTSHKVTSSQTSGGNLLTGGPAWKGQSVPVRPSPQHQEGQPCQTKVLLPKSGEPRRCDPGSTSVRREKRPSVGQSVRWLDSKSVRRSVSRSVKRSE